MKHLFSKNKTPFFILFLGLTLSLTSCQKEDVYPTEPETSANAEEPVKDKEVVILP